MSTAVDTNVIVDVVGGTPSTAAQAAATLTLHGRQTALVVAPVVYAELFAHPAWNGDEIDEFLGATGITVDWHLTQDVWRNAGEAFASYARRRAKQRGGLPRRLLADFVIGAHAARIGALITGDVAFYRTNFPDLRIFSSGLT